MPDHYGAHGASRTPAVLDPSARSGEFAADGWEIDVPGADTDAERRYTASFCVLPRNATPGAGPVAFPGRFRTGGAR